MELTLTRSVVRSWRSSDVASLVTHANNRNVWLTLRDRFPHPYTKRAGQQFIRNARKQTPETAFAIAVDGLAVGGIGFLLQDDVECVSAEIGYWLGEAFWGRGIMTEAVIAMTWYALGKHGLTRVYARLFEGNTGSIRVLEKAGYELEGRLRRSAVKVGTIVDELQYAFIAPLSFTPSGDEAA